MSDKPFDLEAAKRGEAVVQVDLPGDAAYRHVHFVGLSEDGQLVACQPPGTPRVFFATRDELRMAPKKKVWYCRHYIDGHGFPQLCKSREPVAYDPDGDWHGEPFTIEIQE